MILDIHSHRNPPYPEGVISCTLDAFNPIPGQLYSVGVHPWQTNLPDVDVWLERLSQTVTLPEVVAVGEAGIDPGKGAPLFRQLQVFKSQVDISESAGKPLVIHSVKAADIILGLKRDLRPTQPWIIHGFRGKAPTALQFTRAGIYLSFGEKFNPESPKAIPEHMILAETDESDLDIHEIISLISSACEKDITDIIAGNASRILNQD